MMPICLRSLPLLLMLSGCCFADGIDRPLAREIYAELVGINTTDTPAGNCTKAVEAVAKRLKSGGLSGAGDSHRRPEAEQNELGGAAAWDRRALTDAAGRAYGRG